MCVGMCVCACVRGFQMFFQAGVGRRRRTSLQCQLQHEENGADFVHQSPVGGVDCHQKGTHLVCVCVFADLRRLLFFCLSRRAVNMWGFTFQTGSGNHLRALFAQTYTSICVFSPANCPAQYRRQCTLLPHQCTCNTMPQCFSE